MEIDQTYPADLLAGAESGLLLFASGFGGLNDGHWFREMEVPCVTAVDMDADTIESMKCAYPADWKWLVADAFDFAMEAAERMDLWDVVSADLPSSMPLQMVDDLPLWCAVAARFVISTVMRHNFPGRPALSQLPDPPTGWQYQRLIKRSEHRGGVYWLVSEFAGR
jgi:hypothetical protein